jgi:hypothetical protein
MFKIKRKEHHNIIQTLGQMQTDVKRYKAVQMLMDQIFKVEFSDSKLFLENTFVFRRYFMKVVLL